jgi:predicted nucleotidyltransferase
MSKRKVEKRDVEQIVIYDQSRWDLLAHKRGIAGKILSKFSKLQADAAVYGSLARGDVSKESDIDIIIFDFLPSYFIENLLGEMSVEILQRSIVMATPNHAIKAHISLINDVTISFPLIKFNSREKEFYQFGGCIGLGDLQTKMRVNGVDKRLMLIEPQRDGHRERPLLHLSLKELNGLGFPSRLIEERMRVLKRRDQKGRTGVFLNYQVNPNDGFEYTLRLLKDKNPLIRKKIERNR